MTYREGLNLAATGKLVDSYGMFSRSASWYPGADNAWMSKADLARQILAKPEVEESTKMDLYKDALDYLGRAEKLNPYRWQTYVTRGKLVEENPSYARNDWYKQAIADFRQALRVDPRAYEARYRLALLLSQRGNEGAAGAILEEGIIHFYADHPSLIPYLKLTSEYRKRSGDLAGQGELEERIQHILDSYRSRIHVSDS